VRVLRGHGFRTGTGCRAGDCNVLDPHFFSFCLCVRHGVRFILYNDGCALLYRKPDLVVRLGATSGQGRCLPFFVFLCSCYFLIHPKRLKLHGQSNVPLPNRLVFLLQHPPSRRASLPFPSPFLSSRTLCEHELLPIDSVSEKDASPTSPSQTPPLPPPFTRPRATTNIYFPPF